MYVMFFLTCALVEQNVSRRIIAGRFTRNFAFVDRIIIEVVPASDRQMSRISSVVPAPYRPKVAHTAIHVKHWSWVSLERAWQERGEVQVVNFEVHKFVQLDRTSDVVYVNKPNMEKENVKTMIWFHVNKSNLRIKSYLSAIEMILSCYSISACWIPARLASSNYGDSHEKRGKKKSGQPAFARPYKRRHSSSKLSHELD